jgi:hypothetical protein
MPLPMGFMQSKNRFKNQRGVLYFFIKPVMGITKIRVHKARAEHKA